MGLVLGVCLFSPFLAGSARALDANSTLFDKEPQGAVGGKPQASQPLALPEEPASPSPGLFSTLVRIFLALAVIVVLIVLTVWGVKFVWERQGWSNLSEQGKPIKVLTSTYLAPRKVIHLVEVGDRLLIVGSGKDEMNCLDVITDPREVAALKGALQQGFPKIFDKFMHRQDRVQDEAEAGKLMAEGNEVVGGYVDKLKKISKSRKNAQGEKGEPS